MGNNNSIYLPAGEDTITKIHLGPGKPEVEIDVFDLDDLFMLAQKKSKEQSTEWKDEFPSVFKNKTGQKITPGQAVMLWHGHNANIEQLKKSLLHGYESLKKPESPSRRRTKRKQK